MNKQEIDDIVKTNNRVCRMLEEINRIQTNILKIENETHKKMNYIMAGLNNQPQVVNMPIPNIVPDLTPKQILGMANLGWNIEQICYISGYTPQKVMSLYNRARGIKR